MRPITPLCPRSVHTSFTPGGNVGGATLDFRPELTFCFFVAIREMDEVGQSLA